MKKIAVILSGCGVRDGSEVQESVLALLAIKQQGAEYQCFAPDIVQKTTVDHATGKTTQEKRSVLSEAARIARGNIQPLNKLVAKDFDAVFLPGGFGVALNLSNYAEKNTGCEVNAEVKKAILDFYNQKKAIGASCIAPIVLAKVFEGTQPIQLTLGTDEDYSKELESLGMRAVYCSPEDIVSDVQAKVYTTPAYMEKADIAQIYKGIFAVIKKIIT